MCKGALDVKTRLDAFVRESAGMSPEAFADAYRKFLVDVQPHI
jgi:hypothetical protein